MVKHSGVSIFRWLGMAALAWSGFVGAQQAPLFSTQQIDQLTAQIALYPDSLLSQVLMASTYPTDVAEAAKWSRANPDAKGDEAVTMVQNQPWDTSVQSLVAFPQVTIMMGEKPEWVKDLGDAFLAQPEDVMDSVQRLRAQAQKAGNLKSNEQMTVTVEPLPPPETTVVIRQAPPQQIIVIQPAQPSVVFVPQFNPTIIYGPWLWPTYQPIFIPPPPGFWWSTAIVTGVAWGVGIGVRNALWGSPNWGRGDVNINVNRYNNINVNRRLDVNNNTWNHNVNNRRGADYRGGDRTRQDLQRRAEAGNREQYRGRDDSRARAAQTMQDRGVNVDQAAMRDRAQNVDRSAAQERAQSADRAAMQNRAQSQSRDNALRGAGDNNARQQVDRGNASRQAMQQRPDVQRPSGGGGGGGAARAQAQRPSGGGGGGGAARAGGGGGGRGR